MQIFLAPSKSCTRRCALVNTVWVQPETAEVVFARPINLVAVRWALVFGSTCFWCFWYVVTAPQGMKFAEKPGSDFLVSAATGLHGARGRIRVSTRGLFLVVVEACIESSVIFTPRNLATVYSFSPVDLCPGPAPHPAVKRASIKGFLMHIYWSASESMTTSSLGIDVRQFWISYGVKFAQCSFVDTLFKDRFQITTGYKWPGPSRGFTAEACRPALNGAISSDVLERRSLKVATARIATWIVGQPVSDVSGFLPDVERGASRTNLLLWGSPWVERVHEVPQEEHPPALQHLLQIEGGNWECQGRFIALMMMMMVMMMMVMVMMMMMMVMMMLMIMIFDDWYVWLSVSLSISHMLVADDVGTIHSDLAGLPGKHQPPGWAAGPLHVPVAWQRNLLALPAEISKRGRCVMLHHWQLWQGEDHAPGLSSEKDAKESSLWSDPSYLGNFDLRSRANMSGQEPTWASKHLESFPEGTSLTLTTCICHGYGVYMFLGEEGMPAGANWILEIAAQCNLEVFWLCAVELVQLCWPLQQGSQRRWLCMGSRKTARSSLSNRVFSSETFHKHWASSTSCLALNI